MRRRMFMLALVLVLPRPSFAQQVVETGQTMAVTVETATTSSTTVTYPATMMPEASDFQSAPTTTVTRKATKPQHSKLAFWHWFRS
jgi:hypothetical protein